MVLEHVLANRSDGVAFPSIFDLFMQEKMNKSMRSAFLYVLKVLSDTYPSNSLLTRLLLYSEEAYAFSKLLLERCCLELHDSTLSEHFYGMKRVMLCDQEKVHQSFSPLNSERRRKAILLVVGASQALNIVNLNLNPPSLGVSSLLESKTGSIIREMETGR